MALDPVFHGTEIESHTKASLTTAGRKPKPAALVDDQAVMRAMLYALHPKSNSRRRVDEHMRRFQIALKDGGSVDGLREGNGGSAENQIPNEAGG